MSAKALVKPQMRRLLYAQTKRDLVIAIAASVTAGLSYKFLVGEPRKKKYAEFYRTYDPDAAFERMLAKGVFQDID